MVGHCHYCSFHSCRNDAAVDVQAPQNLQAHGTYRFMTQNDKQDSPVDHGASR